MENELKAVDGETLWDMEFGAQLFCIKGLLPQGVCILGGASKIGKSWMVLDWVDKVAKGEPVWAMATTQGTTLYLCLEDNLQRVQHRLYCISDEAMEIVSHNKSELRNIPWPDDLREILEFYLIKYSGKTDHTDEQYVQMSLIDDSDIVTEDTLLD